MRRVLPAHPGPAAPGAPAVVVTLTTHLGVPARDGGFRARPGRGAVEDALRPL